MKEVHSAHDAAFAWVMYEGPNLDTVADLPAAQPKAVGRPSREVRSAGVIVSVVGDGIRITDRKTDQLVRALRFPQGFPMGRRLRFPHTDGIQATVGPDGSVAFLAGLDLHLWSFADGQVRTIATLAREPEAMAISPAARRVAILDAPHGSDCPDWVAHVWSAPEGKPLATLHWNSVFGGSLSYFMFSQNGSQLTLSTDVAAQSGSDFTDDHTWSLGLGPE